MNRLFILILLVGCSAPEPQSWEDRAKELFADPVIVSVEKLMKLLDKQTAMENKYAKYFHESEQDLYLNACRAHRENGINRLNEIIIEYRFCKIDMREMRDKIKEFLGKWFIGYLSIAVPDDGDLSTGVIKDDLYEIVTCIAQIETSVGAASNE